MIKNFETYTFKDTSFLKKKILGNAEKCRRMAFSWIHVSWILFCRLSNDDFRSILSQQKSASKKDSNKRDGQDDIQRRSKAEKRRRKAEKAKRYSTSLFFFFFTQGYRKLKFYEFEKSKKHKFFDFRKI